MARRKSNFELLRIVSIFFIVLFHCSYKSGFSFGADPSVNKLLVKGCWMLGETGVNLFILLSGYFLPRSTFKWKKFVQLVAQLLFYIVLCTPPALAFGSYHFPGFKRFLLSVFPVTMERYWFVQVFLIIYLLSPFLQVLATGMSQSLYRRFLITVLVLYSLLPTVFGVFYNTTEGLMYYNRLIWFIIVYLAGAYIRLHSSRLISTFRRSALVTLFACAALLLSIIVIDVFDSFFAALGTTEEAYMWPPNSVPVVALSLGIFGLFMHLSVPQRTWISRIASTTLGIYLLHDGLLSGWIWRSVFCCANHQSSPTLFVRMLLSSCVILVVGAVIDLVRQFIEKHTLLKLLDSRLFTRRQPTETGD